ncbi:unnamed protein product [Mytilus coruscus]|uniref:B box-type domain-containing protein n=1 Tax=Mytilus coruscus TaxID=42192 RepID=A0A6J8BP14_MYTCO|nr:unnamed protein product [Mytilus coruscus]
MAQAAASTCEICTAGPGEHYCQQCDQLFCGGCKSPHLRTKSCKNHTFLIGPNINKEEQLFFAQNTKKTVRRENTRHLMTDLTKSPEKPRSELVKNVESKVTTSKQNINEIEIETQTYREEVKDVIKTITEEGNYWKQLIDKKVEALIKDSKEIIGQRENQHDAKY